MSKQILTQETLRELLDYNPETGIFTWKPRPLGTFASVRAGNQWNSRFSGKPAGCTDQLNGYTKITVHGRTCSAHQLVWLYVYGKRPKHEIDHINGVRNDNRLKNLRDVPHVTNQQNQKRAQKSNQSCGLLGVTWNKQSEKWQSYIRYGGRRHFVGHFSCPKEAHSAYLERKAKHHPGYVRGK